MLTRDDASAEALDDAAHILPPDVVPVILCFPRRTCIHYVHARVVPVHV